MNLRLLFFNRYLFSNRAGAVVRTMARICWLATLIGVFSLILVSSIMNGFNRSIRNKLLAVEPHLTVVAQQSKLQMISQFLSKKTDLNFHEFSRQDVIIRTIDGRFSGGLAKGLSEDSIYDFLNKANKLKYKRMAAPNIERAQARLSPYEIIVGVDLARDLNLFEGDEVMLILPESLLGPQGEAPQYERMKIKSLFSTDLAELDSKLMLFSKSVNLLRFQSSASGEAGFEIELKNANEFSQLKESLNVFLQDEPGAKVSSWADRNSALFLALQLEKAAMTTFLSLSVLITCFSLVTVLTMLISQKRREIGLLMAIGLSKARASRLFLFLGMFLSGFGLFGGLSLGLFASWLIERYPLDILPDIYFESSIPAEINYAFVGGVAIFCLLVAFLAAYLPVRLYLGRLPAENLRPHIAE